MELTGMVRKVILFCHEVKQSGTFGEAIRMEKPAPAGREKHTENSRLFAKLADSYRARGDIDRAIDILARGLEQAPHYLTARIILAACFTQKGELAKALEEYERILREDPFHTAAMKRMGKLLCTMGKPAEAKEFIGRYLDEVPGDIEMRKLYTNLDDETPEVLDRKEEEARPGRPVKESREEGSMVAQEGPGELKGHHPSEEKEEAPEDVIHEGKEKPEVREEPAVPREEDVIATMTLAELYASQGFLEKAIEIYQKILSKEPSNEVARERIEAMLRRGTERPAGEDNPDARDEAARTAPERGAVEEGGTPGEVIVDQEFERFKKWLTDLRKKR